MFDYRTPYQQIIYIALIKAGFTLKIAVLVIAFI